MSLHVGHLGGRLGSSCWTLGREAGIVDLHEAGVVGLHVGHLGGGLG